MAKIIDQKIEDLKRELANQVYSADDEIEINKAVEEYRKELINDKENEYAYNKAIITAKIEALQEVKDLEEIETEEKKDEENTRIEGTAPTTINLL